MIITLAKSNDAEHIAKIHKNEIAKGFLSSLHISFLGKLYRAIVDSPFSFCVVAKEQDIIIGFIAGVTDLDKFYKYFIKHYFFQSLVIFLPKVFSVSFIKKALETLFYPVKESDLPKPELLTMAVSSQFHGQGIASKIFIEFVREMKKRNIALFKVLVGDELAPAIGFYEKNGFRFIKKTSVHGTSISRIYFYDVK